MFAKLFFSLYFIILVVIYMFQDRFSKKFISFMIFKLPLFLFIFMLIVGTISVFDTPDRSYGINPVMKQRTRAEWIILK